MTDVVPSAPSLDTRGSPGPHIFSAAKLVLVSPVYNEAAHIERVVRSVIAQTRPPDSWIIVDDRSNDETPQILARLESEIPWMTVVSSHSEPASGPGGLAVAAEARAFNRALSGVAWQDYTHIGKLDGDVELPPDYLELLLGHFCEDPLLGLAGGQLFEQAGTGPRQLIRIPPYHVHGAVKLYTRECFEAIGGVPERLGWDTIDETYARMRGYHTRSFHDALAHHLRPWASAGGRLRGRARHGECAYIVRYPLGWVALRSFKVALDSPAVLSGMVFLFGFLRALVERRPRVEDEGFKRFTRRELHARLHGRLGGVGLTADPSMTAAGQSIAE